MLWSTQTILWLYWKAAPKYECYKGHAGPDKKNEIFYRLGKKWDLDNQYNDINILPALPQEVDCLSQRRDPPMVS